jgi:hypothetical protein
MDLIIAAAWSAISHGSSLAALTTYTLIALLSTAAVIDMTDEE